MLYAIRSNNACVSSNSINHATSPSSIAMHPVVVQPPTPNPQPPTPNPQCQNLKLCSIAMPPAATFPSRSFFNQSPSIPPSLSLPLPPFLPLHSFFLAIHSRHVVTSTETNHTNNHVRSRDLVHTHTHGRYWSPLTPPPHDFRPCVPPDFPCGVSSPRTRDAWLLQVCV